MNILLCGHGGALCRQLVQRFNQEKHLVYLLTGSTQDDLKDIKAFQTYPFSYSNDNLPRIMKSSAADVLVMEGAYDPVYNWRSATQQSVRFLSDLTSILAGAKAAGVPRVVFLSALRAGEYLDDGGAAFADANEREIYRTLSSGETLVRSYEDETFKATVLRLPPVFSGSDSSYGVGSVCRRMAEQYLWEHEVRYSANEVHREIFYPDAAEAVRRVVEQQEIVPLLQVAGIEFSEQEFVEALKATGIVDESVLRLREEGGSSPQARKAKAAQYELDFSLKYTVASAARSLLEELQKYRAQDSRNQRKEGSFWRDHLLPIAESLGLFAVTIGITWLIRGTWVGENLNLFYIYVLLIGVVWGMAHSLFASLLAGVATFFMMQESGAVLSLDYGYFVQLLELVVVGVIGGFMRDKYFRRNQDLRDENAFYASEVHDLTRINDSNNYVRNLFEKRLMGYQNSLAKIYEITSQLDFMESRKVIFHAAHVLSQIMETPHVAIYVSSGNGGFFRLAAASSPLAHQMGKSIRYFENSILYRALSHKEIYQNRNMEERYPTFAGAVYRSDSPAAIVMVWMENIEQVNLYSSNLLAIMCRLLESSIHRAIQYEELAFKDYYLPGTRILKESAFLQTLETFEEGRLQGLFEYLLFHVKSGETERGHIEQLVRDTDVLGEIRDEIYVVLSNSGKSDAQVVVERFAASGMELEEADIPAGVRSDTGETSLSTGIEAMASGDENASVIGG